jgi:hypothetical protein
VLHINRDLAILMLCEARAAGAWIVGCHHLNGASEGGMRAEGNMVGVFGRNGNELGSG